MTGACAGTIVGLAKDAAHRFSKQPCDTLSLLKGLGVEGDAHCGKTVKHRSRVAADPTQPNLRQVHLVHAELLNELAERGLSIAPAAMGENILTRDLVLLDLPRGALLKLGNAAVVEVTGLRNPCHQLERYRPGLLAAVLDRSDDGELIRKAGIMGIVRSGGTVRLGDRITVTLPERPWIKLDRV